MKVLIAGLILLLSMIGATSASTPDEIISAARNTCRSLDGGTLDAKDAVTEIDLTGDGRLDTLVDESRFICSTSRSLFCGSGGCQLHAVIGGKSWQFQAEGWRMIDWDGRPILLIARDGGWCGGAGAQVCYEAVVWSAGELLTVMPSSKGDR